MDQCEKLSPQTYLFLAHHGIRGQKWGVRRFQNRDGTLTPKGRARLEKRDEKWAKKNSDKITEKARKKSSKELSRYSQALLQLPGAINKNGEISSAKKAVEKILETTSLGSTPVSQLPTMRALSPPSSDAGKAAAEKVFETAKQVIATPTTPVSAPKVSVSKPSFDIPSTYNFETLMKQNDDLLKKMLDDLAS